MSCRDTSPLSAQIPIWCPLAQFLLFALPFCALPAASHPFSSDTFRYVPKNTFGSLYDSTRPHLSRSAGTFFANRLDDRTANSLLDIVPDYLRSTGAVSMPDLSDVQQLLGSEINSDYEMAQNGGAERKPKKVRSANLMDFDHQQKGQFVRKNCFFSPLQCSFYYKKRSHHRRNAPLGGILADGTVTGGGSDATRAKAF